MIRRITLALGGVLLVAVGAAACTTKPITVEDLQASASPTKAAPSSKGSGRYGPVDDVCSVLDLDPILPAFPYHDTREGFNGTDFPRCSVTVGPSANASDQLATLELKLHIGPVGTFNQQSEFDFDKQVAGSSATNINGLGQGAYYYSDPTTGFHVNLYDGNAYVKVTVTGQTPKFAMPALGQNLIIVLAGRVLAQLPPAS